MPRSIARWMGIAGLLVLGCGPAAKAVNVEQEKTTLMERDRAWSESVTNIDQWLGFFTADASVYPTGQGVVTGADSIRAVLTRYQAMPGFSLHWTPTKAEVASSGDFGYTTGTYEATANDPQGKPSTEHGKYLTVWKKGAAEGAWKVTEDMFNPNEPQMPVPAAPPAKPHR